MKKITLLFTLLMSTVISAQAVMRSDFPTPAGSTLEWAHGTTNPTSFAAFFAAGDNLLGLRFRSDFTPRATYTGGFSRTVTANDRIILRVNYVREGANGNIATQLNVTFSENGTPRTVAVPTPSTLGAGFQDVIFDPSFAPGATISDLSFTYTTSDPAVGGEGDRLRFEFFMIDDMNALSVAEVSEIPGASITAEGGSISVEGATLDAVYALTGQQVSAYGLPKGIYIVRVSKGAQSSTLKVIMD